MTPAPPELRRATLRLLHRSAAIIALLTILSFWLSTVTVELFGSRDAITTVKTAIAWGLLLLIPSLAATALSGLKLSGAALHPLVTAKKKRMPFIAANGILVLAPCAIALAMLSTRGLFGLTFTVIQTVELLAGALNLGLIGLNMRDGFRLRRRTL